MSGCKSTADPSLGMLSIRSFKLVSGAEKSVILALLKLGLSSALECSHSGPSVVINHVHRMDLALGAGWALHPNV